MAEPSDFGNALLTWTSSTTERDEKKKKVSNNKNSQQFLHHPQIAYHPTHGTNYKLDP